MVVPHAAGPVARESPIVSKYRRRSRSASPEHVVARLSATLASERSRRCRDLGHEQVVAHEPGDDLPPFAVEPDAPHHAERDVGPDLRVVTGKSLADVVEERTEQQELRTPAGASDDAVEPGVVGLAGVEQRGALRDGFEQVPIDGEAVVGVALRTGPHVLPLGQESNEDALVVECLEDGDGTGAGPQQPEQRGALPHVPGRLGHRFQSGQRGPLERQLRLGRGGGCLEHAQRRDR